MLHFRKIRINDYIKNVIKLFTGAGLAQVAGLLMTPVLTRLYSPVDFGTFSIFILAASFYSIIKTFALEKAVIVCKTKSESKEIVSSAAAIIVFCDIIIIAAFPLISYLFSTHLNITISFYYFAAILLFSSVIGLMRLYQGFSNFNLRYGSIAKSNVLKVTGITIIQMAAGFAGYNYKGLIVGAIAGSVISVLFLTIKNPEVKLTSKFSKKGLKNAFSVFKIEHQFAKFEMPNSIINELSVQFPLILFKSVFGSATAGFYHLSHKLLAQPSQLIGRSVYDVFIKNSSDLEQQQVSQSTIAFKTFKFLLTLGVVPFSIILFYGEPIFKIIFGEQWGVSGEAASIISPWMLFVFAGSPISSVFVVKRKLKLSFQLNISILILRVGALLTGIFLLNDFITALWLFSAVSFIYWLFLSVCSLKLNGVPCTTSSLFIAKCMLVPLLFYVINSLF
ncbi:oligosaccharide flippase family protein [Marinilabiliaceae bacterium ANBcel2]|nr:oligosaccharide flippase family protein [Marinilabiliaceae bacterium ANBcel2]